MSLVVQKYNIFSDSLAVPLNCLAYWRNEKLVPNELDMYEGIPKITSIRIRIFQNRFLNCEDYDNSGVKYQAQMAAVIITTATQQLKIGLHLFPIMRFKRTDLPSEITLYIKDKEKNKTPVKLPANMALNLLNYLNGGKPGLNFTCMQFVDYLNGFAYDPNDPACLDKYILCPPSETTQLSPGDTVVFINENHRAVHLAIYLTNRLFLWHCGPTCLRISSFDDIMTCYSTKGITIARPKGEEQI